MLQTYLPTLYIAHIGTAHTYTMETHSMEKVPSMESSINQTEY